MRQFVVCSGGGPSIMEAVNRGAVEAGARNHQPQHRCCPREQAPNSYVTLNLAFQVPLFRAAQDALPAAPPARVAVFPGGFGTLDEFFELLTLVRNGKMKPIPILLYGREFWSQVMAEALAERG
ncbi:MAG: LOG family protein [Novosphingobium sp.]|nr:LOG family protein [Novosphingobium sp.]